MSKTTADKPKRGRPPRGGETATRMVPVRMTEEEHQAAHDLAAARGMDLSTLIRTMLAAAARRSKATK